MHRKATDYNGDLADVLARQYESFRQQVPLAGKHTWCSSRISSNITATR